MIKPPKTSITDTNPQIKERKFLKHHQQPTLRTPFSSLPSSRLIRNRFDTFLANAEKDWYMHQTCRTPVEQIR